MNPSNGHPPAAGHAAVAARSGKRPAVEECEHHYLAANFVESLGIHSSYFDSKHNRCYCPICYPSHWPDTISNQGPTPYVVPRGWVRFGLAVHEARAEAEDIWNTWSVSFHGIKSVNVLRSVLQHGSLLKPGDKLLDGKNRLRSTKCAGRQDKHFYTSPTIGYAGLKFYAEPQVWLHEGTRMCASIVLQCRQNPTSIHKKQGETMEFEKKWPGHLAKVCPHVDLKHIEWLSEVTQGAIPYGLLVRVWPMDPYSSAID